VCIGIPFPKNIQCAEIYPKQLAILADFSEEINLGDTGFQYSEDSFRFFDLNVEKNDKSHRASASAISAAYNQNPEASLRPPAFEVQPP